MLNFWVSKLGVKGVPPGFASVKISVKVSVTFTMQLMSNHTPKFKNLLPQMKIFE